MKAVAITANGRLADRDALGLGSLLMGYRLRRRTHFHREDSNLYLFDHLMFTQTPSTYM